MDEFKSGFFVGGEACEGRVLVVDDEPDIRKVVKMTLQKEIGRASCRERVLASV